MAPRLLEGLRVVDLSGEPAALTGRILADLGADVVKIEPPGGDPLRAALPVDSATQESLRFAAWNAGKRRVEVSGPDDARLGPLLSTCDVVLSTPGWPGAMDVGEELAPQAVWVKVTAFGGDGPRASWRASDLGIMAASGNMFSTGDPDRPPVRCTEPSGYAHAGPEAAMATLTALATGRPQVVDVSLHETVLVSNMAGPLRWFRGGGSVGQRQGASMGRTRELWPCADGWVSFGLRGGRARLRNLQTITELVAGAGLDATALVGRDWVTYEPSRLSDDELRAIETPIAAYFAARTMTELYETACETGLMLAPANSPRELYASAQLAARGYFGDAAGLRGLPLSFTKARTAEGVAVDLGPRALDGAAPSWPARQPWVGAGPDSGQGPWSGVRILEFGSGAAGPIATRYFAEQGATVIRVESGTRPDFLRAMALAASSPHGLEGSDLFDALNAGKRTVSLNLKEPEALELVRRLIQWADAIAENFAPKAMRGLGLDYDSLVGEKPDLVMISACLQGQTGPHRDYPGFGGQGSALAGFNILTGWPDRAPVGPHGTITDSLAPRFVATALAAGLLYRRRTGQGVYLDLSQVEAASYTLTPWLLDFSHNGRITVRDGNRSERSAPHGAFPCVGHDRWVAIAVWTDDEWRRLASVISTEQPDPAWATLSGRLAHVDDVEAFVAQWTRGQTREAVCAALQAEGIEAVPVADFGDLFDDPQLAHRQHFVKLMHPVLGEGAYERNGFRLSDAPAGYDRPAPVLGQDNEAILCGVLGLSPAKLTELAERGVVA
jgi:crotonobetainyl-CoA:carnitine CoA-transferase CaiB-like acyl-CoA transferase